MVLENDTRGWIMSGVSGIACILGSSIICIDVLVRLFPGQSRFKVQDSSAFLSASLSLSFGVMLFSALYSMLPSANSYLKKAGFAPQAAAYILIASFLGGVIGIQLLSRLMHHYIPSHVVDCDHSHVEPNKQQSVSPHEHHHDHVHHGRQRKASIRKGRANGHKQRPSLSESTPLLTSTNLDRLQYRLSASSDTSEDDHADSSDVIGTLAQRPSLPTRLTTQVTSLVSRQQSSCKENNGTCYGFSDLCGQENCKPLQSRIIDGQHVFSTEPRRRRHSSTAYTQGNPSTMLQKGTENHLSIPASPSSSSAPSKPTLETLAEPHRDPTPKPYLDHHYHRHDVSSPTCCRQRPGSDIDDIENAPSQYHHEHLHHHHVPKNAFLSIGLQTSIAIALHKLPEGFITFATNHANPKLGFAVFMALFIHNITEGFALALPLYLALSSRWKAMLWASLLGGVSQPLGAGVAAAWFQIAGRSDLAPGAGVYGGMFAVTSGIMTSVALQLFSESLGLNHNRSLCIVFAFIGMGILGLSFALTAE
ncbi:MAG: hypothetical protein M1825_005084 [Sarcosagium campestre]|nr:MAG: hypothetical protein M1825_005084 [Sarcosagium campestre]